jgi:glycosyltransferase involved in cell wall biosynthesis
VPFFTQTKLVATIHDLIPYLFRGRFFNQRQALYFGTMLRRIAEKAARIITVSQSTKKDLVREFQIDPSKINVIYEGVDPIFRRGFSPIEKEEIRRRLNLPDRFILYVGLIKPHKNIGPLIEAVRKLRRKDPDFPKLVIVGKKDKRYPPGYEYLSRLGTDDDLVTLGEVNHECLPMLYQLAFCFVLPSLYEGFGLTVLEAFASECPVLCSNRASLCEVAGGAALFFDPTSDEELEALLEKIAADDALRMGLREAGRRQLQHFSWENAAYETLRIYEEVAGEI